jgi:hypothetical protein
VECVVIFRKEHIAIRIEYFFYDELEPLLLDPSTILPRLANKRNL